MFVFNLKLNKKKFYKLIFLVIIIFVLILCGIVAIRLYKETFKVRDEITNNEFITPTNETYSTILKNVHDNIDEYVGKKIKFSGFVYRVYDIDQKQFVLARKMIINSELQTVIVGFLCNYDDAISLKDNTWINIEGIIEKGNYHGDMPIIKITSITIIDKPKDELVYPPDDNYIPTSNFIWKTFIILKHYKRVEISN